MELEAWQGWGFGAEQLGEVESRGGRAAAGQLGNVPGWSLGHLPCACSAPGPGWKPLVLLREVNCLWTCVSVDTDIGFSSGIQPDRRSRTDREAALRFPWRGCSARASAFSGLQ